MKKHMFVICVAAFALALTFTLVGCRPQGFRDQEQQRQQRRHC